MLRTVESAAAAAAVAISHTVKVSHLLTLHWVSSRLQLAIVPQPVPISDADNTTTRNSVAKVTV